MNKKEILLFFSNLMMLIGFGGLIGISLQLLFRLDSWVVYLSVIVVCGLGIAVRKKGKAFNTYFSSSISQENASRLSGFYNLIAASILIYPFLFFTYETSLGILDLSILSFSALALSYLLKFIDYQTIITPRTIEANVYSSLFIFFSAIQVIVFPVVSSTLTLELRNTIGSAFTSLVIFIHGVWILSMFKASPKELAVDHPRLYYDDMPYRGIYNIVAGFFLIGGMCFNILLSGKSIPQSILAVFIVFVISLSMAPYLRAFVKQRKFMAEIMTSRKYRKEAAKIKKDKWENEVVSRSLVARYLNTTSWSILIFSAFVGIVTLHYSLFTGNFAYLIPAFILLSLVFTSLHYRVATKGERIQDFFRIFRRRKLYPTEIRQFTELALIWYGICSAIFFSFIIPIKGTSLDTKILVIGAFEITNVTILAVFFIFSLIAILYISLYLFRRPSSENADERNRKALQVLVWLTGLTTIVATITVFYVLLTPLSAAIFCSLAIISLVFLFFRATRNL
jgi:hypothetical protein